MIADQGNWEAAWALFHESLRLQPDHPSFSQLEITLLLQQGRNEEARARGIGPVRVVVPGCYASVHIRRCSDDEVHRLGRARQLCWRAGQGEQKGDG